MLENEYQTGKHVDVECLILRVGKLYYHLSFNLIINKLHLFCFQGYKLMGDGKSCEDIDECASHGICHQNCDNVKGSFKCSCADGFQLEPDRRTCKVIGAYVFLDFG